MPKKTAPRPTKTNTGDYLLNFDNIDFSQFGMQQEQQQDEPGILSKIGSSVQAIGEGATMLPSQIVDTVRDAYHGGDIDVTDTESLRTRQAREQERAAYVDKYKGKAFEGLPDAMNSMGYSMATMGASLGAAAAGSYAGPAGAVAAGLGASGAVAYRATKQQFLQQMLGETEKVLGRLPTQDEWDKIATEFDGEATRYGAWEAGPEALSNLFMAKILGPLGKGLLRGSVGQGIKRVGGLYGEELATETATQIGQGQEEASAGLRDSAPGAWDAFKEIGPATFWQTTLMAGGKKGADMLANRMRARSQQVENNADPAHQQQGQSPVEQTNQPALPMAQGILALPQGNGSIPMGSTDTGLGPIAAGVVAGQQPKPFLSDADHADTEAFVRAFEERGRQQDDETALIEYGLRKVRSPAQLALDQGENVNLLSLPQGNGAMAMGTAETGRGPIAPPTDYAGQPIAPPYTHRSALPEQASPSAGMGQWAGGRSQLAYGPRSEPQMMQGLGVMPQQSAPVQPQAMPTSAQINNTQAVPRSDTTADANALGMPAPQAVPQEAMAPQKPQPLPPMMQGIGAAPVQPAPAPQMQSLPAPSEQEPLEATQPALVQQSAVAPKDQNDSRPIGKNSRGQHVFEDRNGVRSYADGGVRVSQSVGVIPGHGISFDAPDALFKNGKNEYLTTDEVKNFSGGASEPESKKPTRIELIRQLPKEEQAYARKLPNSKLLERVRQLSEVNTASEDQPGVVESNHAKEDEHAEANEGRAGRNEGKAESGVRNPDKAPGNTTAGSHEEVHAEPDQGVADERRTEGVSGLHSGTGVERGEHPRRDGEEPDRKRNERGRSVANGARSGDAGLLAGSGTGPRRVKDFRISPDDHIGEGGKVAKFNDNLSAIRMLKEIEQSGRPATEDEQKILARYVGWGGMPEMFAESGKADPSLMRRRTELRELLSQKEFEEARRSTTNAHYTSPQIITAMWDAIKRMGFKGGKILEPSMGIGNFIGLMPDDVYKKSHVTGIELDGVTARIAKLLYPKQTILSQGFETAKMRDGSFDLAISNVPFGDYKLHDSRYAKHNLFIHDYFITRALDLVRPGGVVAFITTTGSLNSGRSMNMRLLAADKARLLGAIRLPGTSFSKNALTDVTTDVLFLQRLGEGETNTGPAWKDTVDTDVVSEKTGKPLRNNEYYSTHPEMMLGQLAEDKLYQGRIALKDDGRDMPAALGGALETLPEGVFSGEGLRPDDQKANANVQMQDAKDGQLLLDGKGNIVQVSDGELKPYPADGKKAARIAGMIGVRDALRSNLRAQMSGDEDSITHSRKALNDAYDAFVRQHGFLNDNANRLAMSEDPDFPLLQALENNYSKGKNGASSRADKADIFTRRTIAEPKIIEHAETPQDALHAQLADIGRVDIPGIAKMTGLSEQAVIDDLHGTIFQNPKGNQWETADDYLSGNVRKKLAEAKKAAEKDEKFKENVKALESVQPQDVPPQDIRIDFGAGWVPSAKVEEFAAKILGISPVDVSARYSKELAQWSLNVKKSGLSNEYGTPERSAMELLNDSLNLKQAKILIDTPEGVIVNKEATIAAREAQRKLREEFSRWILEDEKRAGELARIYNDTYNAMRLYEADGSHLVLPGIADTIDGKPFALRPHQKSAVWRIIQKGNTLVAHAVGAGKTYEMIAAGMEMKRLGMINKPLYVVPNHMLEQWSREFLQAYPAANILVASKADLQKDKRRKFVSRIATGNWDAVVMTHSSYGRIPISVERKEKHIHDQIEQYESALRDENEEKKSRGRSENRLVKQLEKQKMRLEEKLRTLLEDGKNSKDNQVNFEELGVDFMFVDEGHNFKNLSYVTRMQRIAGLPNSHSQRAEDMLLKTQYLDELHPGRSLVFATGTPISNTVAEMYTMTRYVAPHLLRESGLEMFDSWARQFGRTVTGMEISPDGRNFRENTRFSRFTNVPELLTMFRSFADVKTKEDLDLPLPDLKGGKPEVVSVKPSETLTNYVDELVARAERIRGGSVDPRKDNMLKVTSGGRLAALDMRLIDDALLADPNGKVARATDNIFDIWKSTSKERLAQMVFCDLSVPSKQKAQGLKDTESQDLDGENAKPESTPDDLLAATARGSFSVYDEIKKNLVDMGVPADEIAFIHDFNGDKAKAQLFKDVRAGKVRVLLGSTAKMGEGTNVQERLVALHHLDAPWKPSAVEQREGRILRQGNKNKEVQIYTYVTENSFDAYMWQLLESKARFVSTSMRSGVTERDMDDISVTELSAAEAKAAATGDKRILEKVGLDNTISRLTVLKREFDRNQWSKGREVAEAKSRLGTLTSILAAEKKDSALTATLTGKNFVLTLRGKEYTKSTDAAAAIVGIVSDQSIPSGAVIGKAGGFDITIWRKATGYEFSLSGESSISTGDTTSSEGAVTRIVKGASPENNASRIAATEEAIAKTNRKLDGATKWLTNNKSFDRQEELDAALARTKELDDELGLSASKDASVISNEAGDDNDLMASRVNPGEYLPPIDGERGMRLEDVQAVADKIGKVAKNAATLRVVQSFDELPYSLRERYSDAKNSVEGVFDPRSGVVWLVADNLRDPTRAAEVWAHEQIVHHGLRGLLPADARRRVLNQLWLGTGGMKNTMVKDIASRYGLSPTRNLHDRQTVIEEMVAALAEKKGQGLLERAEGNLWRKIVSALHRAWNSLVRAVSGREGAMSLNNIDALLSALGRHVIDGESSSIAQKAGPFEQVAAPASISKEGNDEAELASLSLKDILGLTGIQAAKIADAPEIHHVFKKDDLSLVQGIFNLPHWIAKKAPAFAKVYERQLQRLDERSTAVKESLESVPSIFGKDRLTSADMDSLKKLIWEHEGRDAWQIDASGVDKFVTKEILANGRELISVSPEFYKEYRKWLDGLEGTKAAKDAMLEIRKSLDEDLVRAHNRMAGMSEMSDDAIKEFRQSIGHVPNYFPHHRYGAYFIQAKIGDEVVFRQHFDALNTTAAKQRAAVIAAEQKKNYPEARWTDGKNDRLPDEILGAPIDSEAMEQIIRAATSTIADKDRATEINELLTSGIADVLKARGWGAHGIQRKGVPGFEREDITRVLYDYKSGLNGWLTKMEAAKDFSDALSAIDARRTPNLWKYAAQYVKDMLRNSDRVDRVTGNIKSVAFAWYLGGSIKTAFVNATQNLVVGVPRLQMDVTGGARLWFAGAQKAIVDRVTGNKGKGLNEEEARLVHELYGESVITDAFMEEVRGHLQGVSGAKLWNKFTKVLGLPMSEVERFNRASLALAAFRAAREGNLKAKAKEKYGVKGRQANYDQAKEFATDVVRDAHFVYGKSNMPEFMRSNTAGRSMASLYTFRTFTHNMISMWAWALKTQGKEGAAFVGKSLGATVALGGVTALPFYATLMALCQAATGDDDDWTEKIRSWLPKNNLLRDVVCYGAPAMAGVNIGGSLKMETPLTKGLAKGKTPKDVLTESIGDIIGIPYDLLIEKPSKMIDAQSKGNTWRLLEEAAPVALKNGMQAWRLYTQGQTTMTGRPINDPGTPGARRLSSSEAVGKLLGFQPVSSTKSYDAYAAEQHSKQVRDDKIDDLTVLALKTADTGDPSGRKEMLKDLKAWNEHMKEEGKSNMLIAPKDVIRRVKARRRENRPTPKNLREKARQQAAWS